MLSNTGVQWAPASVDFQTPPSAAPAYTSEEFDGSTASAVMRPAERPAPPPEFEMNGSRKFGSSESYGCVVSSCHAGPVGESALAAFRAARTRTAPVKKKPGAPRTRTAALRSQDCSPFPLTQ